MGHARWARVAGAVAHVVPRVRRDPRSREVLVEMDESPRVLVHAVRPDHRRARRRRGVVQVGVPRLVVEARARMGLRRVEPLDDARHVDAEEARARGANEMRSFVTRR